MIPSHHPRHGVLKTNGEGAAGWYERQRFVDHIDFLDFREGIFGPPSGFIPRVTIPVGFAPNLDLTGFDTFEREGLPSVGVLGRTEPDPEDVQTFEPWVVRSEGPATDWDRVYEEFVILNPEPAGAVFADVTVIDPDFNPTGTVAETDSSDPVAEVEVEPVAFWDTVSDIFTTSSVEYASNWIGSQFAPEQQRQTFPAIQQLAAGGSGPGAAAYAASAQTQGRPNVQDQSLCAVPATNPRYLRYNCQTGQFSKVPRRRRRRLLTSSDLKDLAALKAIVGGGAKMDGAIVQAIRR